MLPNAATERAAAPSNAPPDAPPNTPATDTEASVAWSTRPGPSADYPAGACSRPLPGIKMPPSNQFIPTSDWTKLPNPRDNPASATKYRTPFDELDLELGRSSLVEMPLSLIGDRGSRRQPAEAMPGSLRRTLRGRGNDGPELRPDPRYHPASE